jgi:hypothetical protein
MKRSKRRQAKQLRRRETEPPTPSTEVQPEASATEQSPRAIAKGTRTYRKPQEKKDLLRRVDAGETPESLGITMSQIYQWRSDLKKREAEKQKKPAKKIGQIASPVGPDSLSVGLLSSSLEAGAKALDARGTLPSELLAHDLLFLLARQKHIVDAAA